MALTLNHFTIRTTDIEATRHFYTDVLGLTVGPRPAFPFPGLWIYRGDHADAANAVVHVIYLDGSDIQGLQDYLGNAKNAGTSTGTSTGTGAVDHIAFFADGLNAVLARFATLHVQFEERTVPSIGLHQLFLNDPNGVKIELNYPAAEQTARLALESQTAAKAAA